MKTEKAEKITLIGYKFKQRDLTPSNIVKKIDPEKFQAITQKAQELNWNKYKTNCAFYDLIYSKTFPVQIIHDNINGTIYIGKKIDNDELPEENCIIDTEELHQIMNNVQTKLNEKEPPCLITGEI